MRVASTHRLLGISVALVMTLTDGATGSAVPSCDAGPFGVPVPIEVASGKPFVPVRLNGASPRRFILDTGSFNAALDKRVIDELGFSASTVLSTSAGVGADGGTIVRLQPLACEQLAGVALGDAPVLAMDLSRVATADGLATDGLVGGDLLARHVIAIDYAGRTLRAYPATFEYAGAGVSVPIRLQNNHAFAQVQLRTRSGVAVTGSFLVDTGSRMALLLNTPLAERQHLPDGPAIADSVVGVGLGGDSRGDWFRIANLEWGPLHVTDVPAVASRDRRGVFSSTAFEGVIGADLLSRFVVWLDYPHSRLVLEGAPQRTNHLPVDQSGTFLIATGPDLRTIEVYDVVDRLPAAKAGIRRGDVIVAVNGEPAGTLGLGRIRALFQRTTQHYRIRLRRGRDDVSIELRTGALLE